jgi:hypothetical protein
MRVCLSQSAAISSAIAVALAAELPSVTNITCRDVRQWLVIDSVLH